MKTQTKLFIAKILPIALASMTFIACAKKDGGGSAPPPAPVVGTMALPGIITDYSVCTGCFTDVIPLSNPLTFDSYVPGTSAVINGSLLIQGSSAQAAFLATQGISMSDPMLISKYQGPALILGNIVLSQAVTVANCSIPAGNFSLRPTYNANAFDGVTHLNATMQALHSSGAIYNLAMSEMIPYNIAGTAPLTSSIPPQRAYAYMILASQDPNCPISISFWTK